MTFALLEKKTKRDHRNAYLFESTVYPCLCQQMLHESDILGTPLELVSQISDGFQKQNRCTI